MEIALNYKLNFPLTKEVEVNKNRDLLQIPGLVRIVRYTPKGNVIVSQRAGLPLPSDLSVSGTGARTKKLQFGVKAKQDLINISGMPRSNESDFRNQERILTQYLQNIIIDASTKVTQFGELPNDYVEKTVRFLLSSPRRASNYRTNLTAFLNRTWMSPAQIFYQLSLRIQKYLQSLIRQYEKVSQKETADEIIVEKAFVDPDETPEEKLIRLEEELILKIKMARLTEEQRYFLHVWYFVRTPTRKDKYELLGITRRSQALQELSKIKKILEKRLNTIEQKVKNSMQGIRTDIEVRRDRSSRVSPTTVTFEDKLLKQYHDLMKLYEGTDNLGERQNALNKIIGLQSKHPQLQSQYTNWKNKQ